MSPGISVLMPVFDASDTVERAVDSILSGTLVEIELVVVDDGSTDGTRAKLEALARTDSRIRLVLRPHLGLVPALNEGLRACRSSVIARMDADDWSAPTRLEAQLALLMSSPELDLVSCRVEIHRADGAPAAVGTRRYQAWLNGLITPEAIFRERFVESPVVHSSVLAHRRVFESGYRSGPFPEDYELWLRRLEEGARFAKVPETLFHVTDRPHGLTRRAAACSPEAFRELKLDFLVRGPLEGVDAVTVWGTGRNGKRWIRALVARGFEVPHAIELAPRKIGKRIHGAMVIRPDALPDADHCAPILAAVGKEGGRQWIREWLTQRGFVEGRHFWAVC